MSSTRLLLHGSHLFGNTHKRTEPIRHNWKLLESSAKTVVDIAYTVSGVTTDLTTELTPFAPHSAYLAAIVQARLLEETGDPKYIDAYEALISMLKEHKRWKNSGKCALLLT